MDNVRINVSIFLSENIASVVLEHFLLILDIRMPQSLFSQHAAASIKGRGLTCCLTRTPFHRCGEEKSLILTMPLELNAICQRVVSAIQWVKLI